MYPRRSACISFVQVRGIFFRVGLDAEMSVQSFTYKTIIYVSLMNMHGSLSVGVNTIALRPLVRCLYHVLPTSFSPHRLQMILRPISSLSVAISTPGGEQRKIVDFNSV